MPSPTLQPAEDLEHYWTSFWDISETTFDIIHQLAADYGEVTGWELDQAQAYNLAQKHMALVLSQLKAAKDD